MGSTLIHQLYMPQPRQSCSSGTAYPIENFLSYTSSSYSHLCLMATIEAAIELKTFRHAIMDPHWQVAMAEEIRALELNQTKIIQ